VKDIRLIFAQHQASTKGPGQLFALSTNSASTEPTLSLRQFDLCRSQLPDDLL
jgi:hypothetical protein